MTGLVNYLAGETDTGVTPSQAIGAWTTVDANLVWRANVASGLVRGTKVALAVSNLLDRRPPFASSPGTAYSGIYFDSTNVSALGRFVSLTLSKAW